MNLRLKEKAGSGGAEGTFLVVGGDFMARKRNAGVGAQRTDDGFNELWHVQADRLT